jgi:hypothetical protein
MISRPSRGTYAVIADHFIFADHLTLLLPRLTSQTMLIVLFASLSYWCMAMGYGKSIVRVPESDKHHHDHKHGHIHSVCGELAPTHHREMG